MSDSQVNLPTLEDAPEANGTPEYIRIKVVGQDTNVLHFRVKFGTSLGKVKKTYAERTGVTLGTLKFLFDEKRIHDDDTPKSLEMEEDAVVDVFQEQNGGSKIRRSFSTL